ncbi:MAG TPA: hypothetical protein VFQ17_05480 [Nocardioides sp.]|nr:hypothetical protein [Nocardioides sp.]
MVTPEPSLYDWAGGSDAFRRLIDACFDRVERDDLLAPLFPGGVSEQHRSHVTTWWVEVFGGPAAYPSLGGYGHRAPSCLGSPAPHTSRTTQRPGQKPIGRPA